ncbi:MAG TPA: tail fiber domain-containing protein, partial [Tenuifilum sp.]|uniref:tail fiber domain-containing protein n=1 Tax=Tenuifilum sp. TaxID=2760880 RepID=UPI002B93C560|nr:tail fiber domain-containing protein [Tenuifilum sp.]
YNTTSKISYIWDGDTWEILAQDGLPGAQGPQGPEGPQGPAGTGLNNRGDWVSGTTYDPGDYVFALNTGGTANSMWILEGTSPYLSTLQPRLDPDHWVEFEAPAGPAGQNGISIQWLGTLPAPPSSPVTNQAYYNSVAKKAYIWDGDSWEILAQDGEQGPPGPLVAGTTGQTLRHDGTSWAASSLIYNNATNIGINTTTPTQRLDVNGNMRLRGLLVDYGNSSGTSGQYLSRGTSGVVWQTPSWVTGSGVSGQMAVWNGASSITNLPNLTFAQGLVVVGNPTANPDDPIFEVKNSNGEVIFGVYQEGVRINIGDEAIKGAKGGFAVGGLTNQTKAGPVEYLRITPDSARIYIKQDSGVKGAKGGFAVGGLTNQTKTVVAQDLLFINPDSARIYLNENPTKGAKGGFAVGGLTNQTKASSPQLIQLTKDNYLIGYEAGMSITTGLYNSFLGYQTGKLNNAGNWNTFLGYQAGLNNTGSDNTFIGYQAGMAHTTKGGNVYIGSKAGSNATNGERNVFIGESAGYSIVSGFKNVFIGFESGYSTSTGNYNVFLGTTTGRANTSGSSNVFVGIGSGFNNTTGSNNVFLGTSSGLSNISGNFNTFLGYDAGYSNTASYNLFVGYQAGRANTSGTYNTFLGFQSGYANVDGSNNIFIGLMAGMSNTSAGNNVFIGNESGRYNTTGTNNSFLGNYTGRANTTGNSNVFIGNQSGRSNTTGNSNIAIGDYAGYSNQTGVSNIFLGKAAGYTGTNLQYNVFIGDSTGYSTSSTYATTNVFIGYAAGRFNNSYNNVYIGNKAGYSCITGQNNIAIGDLAGFKNTSSQNIFIGTSAGENNTEGYFNIMIGRWTGKNNTTGHQQILIGGGAGSSLTTGNENVIIGTNAGSINSTGSGNIYLGTSAGWSNTGSKNVFIGYKIGYGTFQNVSNALVIGTDVNPTTPLIYGEFDNKKLKFNANVGVNVDPTGSKLFSYDDRTIAVDDPAVLGEHKLNTTGWGIGVKGDGGYMGVYGVASVAGTGTRYGVYGYGANGTTNYAGYFSGNVYVSGTFTNPSDERLKKNITPLKGSLAKLSKITGVTFEWKSNEEIKGIVSDKESNKGIEKFNFPVGTQIGVIAQDVEKVFPELVQTDENGVKSVDYVKLVPVLIESIKEQQQQINNLQEQINELQRLLIEVVKQNK